MAVQHHTMKASMLRHGHLLYTGGSGNYVLVATATPGPAGHIEVSSYNGEIPDPGTIIYRLDPDSEVSVSAMVPLPVQLSAAQWENVISLLNDLGEELRDGVECEACDGNPPFCEDHQSDAKRAADQFRIATLIHDQIGRQQPGHAPGISSATR